jgi:rhodanese-related sulfurtransferase
MSVISAGDFKKLYDQPGRDWALFDIREKGEAADGHIFGATNLPRRLIEYRIAELVPDRATRIFIYGDDNERASLALKTLHRLGYANAAQISGGVAAWVGEAGGALSTGSNVPSKDFGEKIHVQEHVPSLSVVEFAERKQRGDKMVVCDVRTPEEFLGGHIPGAVSCPSFDITLNAFDLSDEYNTIIVNCAGRTRSIIGTSSLQKLGLANVYALENGTSGWLLEEWKLEKGPVPGIKAPTRASLDKAERGAAELGKAAGVRHIDLPEFKAAKADAGRRNMYVFDVRPVADFERGHIPGASALPGGQAVQRADDFFAVRDGMIVLIDRVEARAMMAGYWLRKMGFPNVFVLKGGVEAWIATGNPLATGRQRGAVLGLEQAAVRAKKIGAAELAGRVARGALLIDVGHSRQYAAGHLPGALWRPRGWLELIIPRDVAKDREIIVSAQQESEAILAAATLQEMGYSKAVFVEGGNKACVASGSTLQEGEPADVFGGPDFVLPPYEQGREGMLRYLDWEIRLGRKYESPPAAGGRTHDAL